MQQYAGHDIVHKVLMHIIWQVLKACLIGPSRAGGLSAGVGEPVVQGTGWPLNEQAGGTTSGPVAPRCTTVALKQCCSAGAQVVRRCCHTLILIDTKLERWYPMCGA